MDITALKLLITIFPHFSLIEQIFKNNYIHDGVFIHCHNNSQIIVLQKAFNDAGIKMLAVKDDHFGKYRLNIKKTKVGIVLDASCNGWIYVFENFLNSNNRRINWIVNTNNLNSTTRILSQLQLRMDSNVLLINNNSRGFNLYEVYNTGFKRNGIFVVRDVGFWNSSLFTREQSRYNLKGTILNCVSVITEHLKNETYMHFLEASRHDRTDTLHKLKFYTVIRYLQEMYNFR